MISKQLFHNPVMVSECLHFLSPEPGKTYLDCTLGGGGHSLAILEATAGKALVIGLDMDPEAVSYSRERLSQFEGSVILKEANFIRAGEILKMLNVNAADGLLCDLGVSSWQLEKEERGFSFQKEGPLDMRMNPKAGFTAADILNSWREDEILAVLKKGEVPLALRIAREIVRFRTKKSFHTTQDLVNFLRELRLPFRRTMHPATLVFQALRIAVNRELENLSILLSSLPDLLKPKGRAVFIAYHSLEDRLIKTAFRTFEQNGTFSVLTKKVVRPSEGEIAQNPRSRSARLRTAERR
ncbi:MAG: 16S rRNA (cytosine(1402)-N(4))-methyltransferase RsmH [Coprothermobacterota bacterium]|nr:16S rRNA (cytosine(1402)-N(4))-methyltransferase RsmH [Coprothermobacterota bacterium]